MRDSAYRDGGLFATKFAGKGHWESHLAGDELIHILDGTATLEIVCDDGPPKSFALRAGMLAVNPRGAWHRFYSSESMTLMPATPSPREVMSSMSTIRGRSSASRHKRWTAQVLASCALLTGRFAGFGAAPCGRWRVETQRRILTRG